jgi:ABC-type antimicrobial peptide transport system permease subunit
MSGGTALLLARTDGNAATLLEGIRREAQAGSPAMPYETIATLETHIESGLASPRLVVGLLSGFSVIAMLLTALGIYAVLSFGVQRRSAELGIRMALGAARGSVVASVVRDILVTVMIGLVAGLAIAAAVAPRVEGLLYDVRWRDPASFGAAAGLLILVAAIAAFLPARRAVAIDPVESLRARP